MTDTQTLSIEERRARLMLGLGVCQIPVKWAEIYDQGGDQQAIQLIFKDNANPEDIKRQLNRLLPSLNCRSLEYDPNGRPVYTIEKKHIVELEETAHECAEAASAASRLPFTPNECSQAELKILNDLDKCGIAAERVDFRRNGINIILPKTSTYDDVKLYDLAEQETRQTEITGRGYLVTIGCGCQDRFMENLAKKAVEGVAGRGGNEPGRAALLQGLNKLGIPIEWVGIDKSGAIRLVYKANANPYQTLESLNQILPALSLNWKRVGLVQRGYCCDVSAELAKDFEAAVVQAVNKLEHKSDEVGTFIQAINTVSPGLFINLKREGDGYSLNVANITKAGAANINAGQLIPLLNERVPGLNLNPPP